MKLLSALTGGIAGAVVLTLIHETVRRLNNDAPRMDALGMEALAKTLNKADREIPEKDTLFNLTMAGDLISNSLYYSLAGAGGKEHAVVRGALLGIIAGAGAVFLPKPLGLNEGASNRTFKTQVMTVALYTAGGLTAGAISELIENEM